MCVAPFSQEDNGILSCRNTLWVAAFMVLGEVVKKVGGGGGGHERAEQNNDNRLFRMPCLIRA